MIQNAPAKTTQPRTRCWILYLITTCETARGAAHEAPLETPRETGWMALVHQGRAG